MGIPATLSSVPNQTPYIQYVATNGQTVFPYPFVITQDADLAVIVNKVALATDSGYALSGVGNPTGGNLTFTSGRTAGDIITLYRDIGIQRISQIAQNSGFSSALFNAEYNNVYLILQQLAESQASFGLSIPITNNPPPVVQLTPANYAGKYLAFDANGNPTPAALTSSGTLTTAILAGFQALTVAAGDVRNYGAVSGANCTSAVSAAAAANGQVVFPAGNWIISSNPSVPNDVVLLTLPGSTCSGTGASTFDLTQVASYQYNVVENEAVSSGGFRSVASYAHTYGGSATTGGRTSLAVQSSLNAPSSPSNGNRNYVAGNFETNINANDNGTSPNSFLTAAGAGFGIGAVCILGSGATSILNATAAEFNIACQTGSSVYIRTIIQLSELISSTQQGKAFDVMVSLSNQGGVGFQTGIGFNASSGFNPITATGTLIATQGAGTVAGGVNLTSYTFTAQAFASTGFAVQGNGTEMDVGLTGTANTYLLNFHTGATGTTYDSRIVATGGTGSNGGGTLFFNAANLGFYTATGVAKQTVTGSKGGNAAVTSLMAAMAALGLVTDSTT